MHDDDPDALTDIARRPRTRAELQAEFGEVWDEQELNNHFVTTAIIPPTYIVSRRSEGMVGSVLGQPRPKLFFRFRPSRYQDAMKKLGL